MVGVPGRPTDAPEPGGPAVYVEPGRVALSMGTSDFPRDVPRRNVFTYLTGQYDNLGDALLRRAMVQELADLGEWYVYLGRAPEDYIAALRLPEHTRIYRSPVRWYLRALGGMIRWRRAVFLSNPGEISSTRGELILGMMSASLMIVGRLFRNPGLRTGIGARDRRRPLSLGHEMAVRVATANYWRDSLSRDLYGRGGVAPDWAFALRPYVRDRARYVALSYRGDKPTPSRTTLDSLREWATGNQLELVVVTQVARDFAANERLANRFGIRHIASNSGDLSEVEQVARHAYSQSAIVLSNRIHCLIVAAIDGAVPGAILAHPDIKVGRTMGGAGVQIEMMVEDEGNAQTTDEYMDGLMSLRSEVAGFVQRARLMLDRCVRDISGVPAAVDVTDRY